MARKAGSIGDETARALRAAALELFARQGYAAVSMRAIAAKVGVQAAAIYNHFPTKQAILVALLKTHMEELLWAADKALTAEGSPGERLDRFTRFHIQHHLPRADGVFVSYMELRSLEPEPFEAIERLRRRYEDGLVAILEAGNRDGSFAVADTRVTAMAIIAMLTGVTTWYREQGRLSIEEIEEIYADLVARSVGAQPTEKEAA